SYIYQQVKISRHRQKMRERTVASSREIETRCTDGWLLKQKRFDLSKWYPSNTPKEFERSCFRINRANPPGRGRYAIVTIHDLLKTKSFGIEGGFLTLMKNNS